MNRPRTTHTDDECFLDISKSEEWLNGWIIDEINLRCQSQIRQRQKIQQSNDPNDHLHSKPFDAAVDVDASVFWLDFERRYELLPRKQINSQTGQSDSFWGNWNPDLQGKAGIRNQISWAGRRIVWNSQKIFVGQF